MNERPILVAGIPRSGTTWIAEVLRRVSGRPYVHEPDNEKVWPTAWVAKRALHRFPYLAVCDVAPDFEALWRSALHASPARRRACGLMRRLFRMVCRPVELESCIRARCGQDPHGNDVAHVPGRHRIIAGMARKCIRTSPAGDACPAVLAKSVHASLCLEWLAARCGVVLVIVVRNPFSVLSSIKALGLPDGTRNVLGQSRLQRDLRLSSSDATTSGVGDTCDAPAQIAVLLRLMELQIRRHPEWQLVSYDRLCGNPQEGFSSLIDRLGLQIREPVDRVVQSLSRQEGRCEASCTVRMRVAKRRGALARIDQDAMEKRIDEWRVRQFLLANGALEDACP